METKIPYLIVSALKAVYSTTGKNIKKIFFLVLCCQVFFLIKLTAQNVGIGTITPVSKLHIKSDSAQALTIENPSSLDVGVTTGLFFSSGLGNLSTKKYTGAIKTTGTGATTTRLGLFTTASATPGELRERLSISNNGWVGINTISPSAMLDVNGVIHADWVNVDADIYAARNIAAADKIGVGSTTLTPSYPLHIFSVNGPASMLIGNNYTSGGGTSLRIGLSSSTNGFTYLQGIQSAGSAWGTLKLNPEGGNVTVGDDKGVVCNAAGPQNIKVFAFTTATFYAVLPGFGLSAETTIVFNGGFTSAPNVFVGAENLSGGSSGELHRVQLQLYGCTTIGGSTTCKARLLNTSPNPVNYNITWNCVAIGF